MPVYWKWLYTPKRQGETQQDKIIRKLSFKLPAVVRYNFAFAFFFGVLGAFYTKRNATILYFYRFTPLCITALCYQQIYRQYRFMSGLSPVSKEVQPTMIDLIRKQQKQS